MHLKDPACCAEPGCGVDSDLTWSPSHRRAFCEEHLPAEGDGSILFFDTETTGLPKSMKASVENVDNWPRMVQLAWHIDYNDDSCTIERDYIIKPEGYTIPDFVASIHGITTERAMDEGVPLLGVLEECRDKIFEVEKLVAHNMDFDKNVLGAEFIRAGFWNFCENRPKCCTMKSTTMLCGLKNKRGGPKWPKLAELHQFLFGCGFESAHNARADVAAGVRCYRELKRRGVL
jgi:DNA polymerase-3 subunit epsilon